MTRFWRSGFYRTSSNGNVHWVAGHWVERDDWRRFSAYPVNKGRYIHLDASISYDDIRGGASIFVKPNARCPVCGSPVFYYENVNGGKVYFDELGPPWPKHPCLDDPYAVRRASQTPHVGSPAPKIRHQSDVERIEKAVAAAGMDFRGKRAEISLLAELAAIKCIGGSFYCVGINIEEGRYSHIYFRYDNSEIEMRVGTIFGYGNSFVSFFELGSFSVFSFPVHFFPNAGAFRADARNLSAF